MEIEEARQTITVNKLISTRKETITIEGDMIVPDIKPDILNTIDTVGNVCIYKKEVLDGKVRFDGSIQLNIIYLADSENDFTRGLTTSLDFTQLFDIDDCRAGMNLRSNVCIQNIECKVLNGRKINSKVTLEMEIMIYSNEEINILKQINNIEGLQTLNSTMKINSLVGIGNCKAVAKDTIYIGGENTIAEILKTEIALMNNEMKVSYNKILLKADANIKILYLTETGEIKLASSNIPVMGFIDMNNVSENHILSCQYEMKNILIKPNLQEKHSIDVDIEFEVSCEANDSLEIELIQDMYCPTQEVNFKKKEINTITDKQINREICNIKEKISIPEISSNQIYDVEINPSINQMNVLNGRVIYEGEISLNFLFSSEANTRIDAKRYQLPYTFTVNNEQINSNKVVNTQISCINNEFVVTADGMIECKMDLEFGIESYRNVNINMIDEINLLENNNEEMPSLVIYLVKDGDTLWNIAKRYRTTVEDILNVNHIENANKISIGQKLFIPRYSMNKIA